jgi:hypothetical protein
VRIFTSIAILLMLTTCSIDHRLMYQPNHYHQYHESFSAWHPPPTFKYIKKHNLLKILFNTRILANKFKKLNVEQYYED